MARETSAHLPPMPLVPYAVSLALTTAYRLIRDQPHDTNLQKAEHDLAQRCEILETLSGRWSSADAMAKLGRKALESLQQWPRKPSTANTVDAVLENEARAGKYASAFERRGSGSGSGSGTGTGSAGVGSHALDVLSTAAATHAANQSAAAATAAATMDSSTNSSGLPGGPLAHPTSQGQGQQPVGTIVDVGGYPALGPGGGAGLSVVHNNMTFEDDGQFQDLDILFGDFFDLSMPTFFQDPLFENSAYLDYPVTFE